VSALESFGAGATGSRLVTGTLALHLSLEAALAARLSAPAALVLSSGYLANLAALCTLAGPGVTVFADRRNHASLIDACRLSRASVVVFDGLPDLSAATGRAVVATDAVFSLDGSVADLTALHAMVRQHDALLLVDEAHALGVLGLSGQGACFVAGIASEPDVVRTITLSKALGGQGGAVLCSAMLRDHLIDTARAFIFDTGLAPASVGAALAALELMGPARVAALAAASARLADAVGVPQTPGAIVQVPVGDPWWARDAQAACRAKGVRVGCFRPPSVPEGQSCLRLTARADLTADDIARGAAAVLESLRPLGSR
jgi:8-amino-7-oxononanoate synthase